MVYSAAYPLCHLVSFAARLMLIPASVGADQRKTHQENKAYGSHGYFHTGYFWH